MVWPHPPEHARGAYLLTQVRTSPTPLPLLRAFLAQQHVPTSLAWGALVENDTNALHLAWVNMPPADRARVEHMLRQVHELTSEVGAQLLVREAGARATTSPRASANSKGTMPGRCGCC